MRLAIFARGLDRRPTGRGLVARELSLAIRRIRPDVDIQLFAAADPGWPGIVFRPAKGANIVQDLWRIVWGVSADLRRTPPTALWGVTHLLPLGLPSTLPAIATLLDVVWRDHPTTMKRRSRIHAAYAEHSLRRADRIVCISDFTRQRMTHYWPDLAGRARVLHLAPRTPAAHEPTITIDAPPIVANVDTIEPRKNLAVLLDAMVQLPEATLVQCGAAGWKVEMLVARAERMRNVRLMGYADEAFVHGLYRQATVAVFPSIYEGFHLPPLEAMALGCPVIASDIPVHREVLGDAAVYVAPSDVPGLTAAIRRLIESPDERARLAAAGRAQAARYSWDDAARRLLAVIEEAIGERRARRTSDRS